VHVVFWLQNIALTIIQYELIVAEKSYISYLNVDFFETTQLSLYLGFVKDYIFYKNNKSKEIEKLYTY